jgi:antitoxin HicB
MPSKRRQPAVALNPLVAAKVSLYNAMLEAGESNVALARKLGVTETVVRQLLDLDHRSQRWS